MSPHGARRRHPAASPAPAPPPPPRREPSAPPDTPVVEAPAPDQEAFVPVRDFAVSAARSVAMVPLETIEEAIAEGERALAVGPVLDPTLFRQGADELATQLRVIKALRNFRLAVEAIRPGASP